MKAGQIKTVSEGPVYCKDCGSRNSWQRKPEADIKSDSGQVMWESWICTSCGHSTITPVSPEPIKTDTLSAPDVRLGMIYGK